MGPTEETASRHGFRALRILFGVVAILPAACRNERLASGDDIGLVVTPTQIELGDVLVSSERRFEVKLRNRGDEMIQFAGVGSGCGCTDVGFEAYRVGPGRETRLTGLLRSGQKTGEKRSAIELYVAKPMKAKVRLLLTANIEPLVKAAPESVTLRPRFLSHEAVQASLRLENCSDEPVEMRIAQRTLPAGVEADAGLFTLPPRGSRDFALRATGRFLNATDQRIFFETLRPKSTTFPVTLRIAPADALQVRPRGINVGITYREKLLSGKPIEVEITGARLAELQLSEVACPSYLKLKEQARNGTRLSLAFVFLDHFTRRVLDDDVALRFQRSISTDTYELPVHVLGVLEPSPR